MGEGPEMRQVRQAIRLAAGRRSTVLVTGKTGTGKELAARSIHLASQRSRAAWVAVNCRALPENLREAELFGHVKGAFTGALQNRVGRFEEAQGGTSFQDEIGDLDLALQAKLLPVIQERESQRLGSSETVRLNVRLIAATKAIWRSASSRGGFARTSITAWTWFRFPCRRCVNGGRISPGWQEFRGENLSTGRDSLQEVDRPCDRKALAELLAGKCPPTEARATGHPALPTSLTSCHCQARSSFRAHRFGTRSRHGLRTDAGTDRAQYPRTGAAKDRRQ
jgi:hypothetical protein